MKKFKQCWKNWDRSFMMKKKKKMMINNNSKMKLVADNHKV